MPELRLTERRISDLPSPNKSAERYWDTEVKGLFVRVLASGRKAYGFFDRLNGEPVWGKNMPECSQTTLSDMRKQAIRWKADIREGKNPFERTARVEERELTVQELCRENLEAMTSRAIDSVSAEHLRNRRLYTELIEKHRLGKEKLTDVSVREAEAFLSEYHGRTAEMLRAWLRHSYNFAIGRSYVPIGFNPWKYCEKRYEPPRTEELERFDDNEISILADYLRKAQRKELDHNVCPIWIAYTWFLIRTGSRPSDTRKIEKKWIRRQGGSWIVDHPRTKTGRKILVLPDQVMRELTVMRWEIRKNARKSRKKKGNRTDNIYLFPGRAGNTHLCRKKAYYFYGLMRNSTGLDKAPYAIRRWFAQTGRKVYGGDIGPVQKLCGWESEEIAQRYAGDDESVLIPLIMENAEIGHAIGAQIDEVIGS